MNGKRMNEIGKYFFFKLAYRSHGIYEIPIAVEILTRILAGSLMTVIFFFFQTKAFRSDCKLQRNYPECFQKRDILSFLPFFFLLFVSLSMSKLGKAFKVK